MKRLIALALTVFALAAIPVAFGDDGSTPPVTGAPAAGTAQPQGQLGQRLQALQARIQNVELRFAKFCGSGAKSAPPRCTDVANRAEARLTKLDANIQARIAKIQQTCDSTSTDPKCKNAADRIALLQKIDAGVNALNQKVQGWLAGTTTSTSGSSTSTDPSSDSSLDQAAAGLGKLTQQVGANG
jgi:hypothetical protein